MQTDKVARTESEVVTSAMEAGYDGAIITGDAAGQTEISSPRLGSQFEIDAKIFYEYGN
jgi:hypothetical protein